MDKVNSTQVELPARYLKKTELPIEANISEVKAVAGKYNTEYQVTLVTPNGYRDLVLWGDNLVRVVTKYGSDYSKWLNCSIYVELNEKGWKVVRV